MIDRRIGWSEFTQIKKRGDPEYTCEYRFVGSEIALSEKPPVFGIRSSHFALRMGLCLTQWRSLGVLPARTPVVVSFLKKIKPDRGPQEQGTGDAGAPWNTYALTELIEKKIT